MERGIRDLHMRDRREREKEVDGGDFGVENREQGNDLLDDKEGRKNTSCYNVRAASGGYWEY